MRPVLDGDLIALARVVMTWPSAQRGARLAEAISQVEEADAHREREGRAHPKWGNGSLMSWALGYPAGSRDAGNPEYLRALAAVCTALIALKIARAPSSTGPAAYVIGSSATKGVPDDETYGESGCGRSGLDADLR
ncbi:hypothetical protein [Thioclava sp.]|uniref:DUF7742 family protein n=1 Tax=Thioclava sp. TaxID=1933450 RepID=UPI003AA81BD5